MIAHQTSPHGDEEGTYPCGCVYAPHRWISDMTTHLRWHESPEPVPMKVGHVGSIDAKALQARKVMKAKAGAEAVKVRGDARESSRRAAGLALPRSGTQRAAVLAVIGHASRHPTRLGATDAEISTHLGLNLNSVRPRRLELVEAGIVAPAMRGDRDGHTVWALSQAAVEAFGRGSGSCRCGACTPTA